MEPDRQPDPAPVLAVEEISAGGVCVQVKNGIAYVALIARRNRAGRVEWCLPKGHIEEGETLVETAEREVCEETGITSRALASLGVIDYYFSTPGYRIHKKVHHYLLEALSGTITAENDPDQEPIDAAWFALKEAIPKLTFPNERRMVGRACEYLRYDY